MNTQKFYYFGNWKLNGSHQLLNRFTQHFKAVKIPDSKDVCLFVPYIYLHQETKFSFAVGAQDCSAYESGAYTGDVSASMLRDNGVRYVLIGHSERRSYYQETTDVLLDKCQRVLEQQMIPVVCLGESLDERQKGQTLDVLKGQLTPFLKLHQPMLFAYEPLWAIGTGISARKEDLDPVYDYLTSQSPLPFLYGGSVTEDTIEIFRSHPQIQGVLVGGASLDPQSWARIIGHEIL